VLDIGSSKIACLIGRTESDGTLRVLGFGWQRAKGVRGGNIAKLTDTVSAIRTCVGQAEDMADIRLRSVTVNLSCGQPGSRPFNVQWPIGGRQIQDRDIRDVVNECRIRTAAVGRDAIHTIPQHFTVDATDQVEDPRGLFCTTLNASLHVIDADAMAILTLRNCIAQCDLDIDELVSAPMAAGLATLVDDERKLGTTVIDMGGGTTGMAVFADGQLLHTSQLPIGGAHVTKDIATGISTTLVHAERLKTLYGNVQTSPDDEREMLMVPIVGEEDHQLARIPRSQVVNIIRPRIEETFEYVKDRLDSAGLTRAAGNRVVLTGGACQLAGVRDLAARMLGRQVRLGRPMQLRGLPEMATGPAFATAGGLLSWAAGAGRGFQDLDMGEERQSGLLRRIVDFLRERI
ncbi:MAG: cell division protein FtsA, partial [Rhodospirillales bacterium]